MKVNAPLTLNDREKAALERVTRYIPRIRFEIPAKTTEVAVASEAECAEVIAETEEKRSVFDKLLGRNKPYPY